ncbi:AraC family transcriptional regulator, partial [Ruegeria sp. HKCCA5491]|uniref:helix-turn-helix domain-containing protein n=1 Tax=Ruegeria sp. HKCCA5491 TaxID=2682986 RepID=UPI00148961E7
DPLLAQAAICPKIPDNGQLQTTDMKIGEIAASLGYTSSSNFTRAFRAWTGHSPGEFRRTMARGHC